MAYALPTNTDYVSCSQPCHKNRNPPSSEPGTDYASGYGAPLYAVGDGWVVDYSHSNSGGTGRYLTIDLDDGRRTRSLHLSEVWVTSGRVARGQQIGKTGASGYGSDWGYGAHVHQTLWAGHYYEFCSTCTLNFEDYVGAGPIAGNQRVVGSNTANGRSDPSTNNPVTQTLAPGTVADFNGYTHGQSIDGNDVWFRGAHSGDWFWSGGFTDTGTHDLAFVEVAPPLAGNQRVVGSGGVNGRATPQSSGTLRQTLPPATVADFNGWTNGDSVDGNDVWFRGAYSGDWFWSGGFTDTGTHDLTQVDWTDPTPPPTVDPDNPRGLPEYTPVYPRATNGLETPLGFADCQNPVERASRDNAAGEPRTPIIDRYVFHWTGVLGDQLDYFSYCNGGSSDPTFYTRQSGQTIETIRPGAKPAATGSNWNWRSIATEFEMGPDEAKPITDEQLEEAAQQLAWLASFNGQMLDGVPVDFTLDREHVIADRETRATECPGDYLYGLIDSIILRAIEILGGDPDPCADCPPDCMTECPECPECPEVPADHRVVSVEQLTRWRNDSSWLIGDEINTVILDA